MSLFVYPFCMVSSCLRFLHRVEASHGFLNGLFLFTARSNARTTSDLLTLFELKVEDDHSNCCLEPYTHSSMSEKLEKTLGGINQLRQSNTLRKPLMSSAKKAYKSRGH